MSATALGEFAEGFSDPEDPLLRTVREQHLLLPIDERTALAYGRITRALRQAGRLIGTNDVWIAATSVRYALPLVTREYGAVRPGDRSGGHHLPLTGPTAPGRSRNGRLGGMATVTDLHRDQAHVRLTRPLSGGTFRVSGKERGMSQRDLR